MRTRFSTLRGSSVLSLAALAVGAAGVLAPRTASAVESSAGVEAGIAARSHESTGAAVGFHLELGWKDIYVGPYYMHEAPYETVDGSHRNALFNSVGGRVRYAPLLVHGLISPFVTVGLGYSRVDYSSFRPTDTISSPSDSHAQFGTVVARSGSFAEVPIGLGVGVRPVPHFQLSVQGYVRPGFSFGGSAFDDGSQAPVERKPTIGLTGTLGASVEF